MLIKGLKRIRFLYYPVSMKPSKVLLAILVIGGGNSFGNEAYVRNIYEYRSVAIIALRRQVPKAVARY